MQINYEDIKILRIEHKGYELAYSCFVGRYTMNRQQDDLYAPGECRIRIEDLHEIDEMIGALQEMRKQCENLTRWKRMPIN